MKVHEKLIDPTSEYYIYTPSLTARQLFFYPTHIGLYHYLSGYSLKRSNFNSFLLMLILDGECDLNLNGKTLRAGKGTLTLIDCYMPHQYKSSCGWKSLWIHFNGPLARNYYNHLSKNYGNVIIPSDFYTIYHEIQEILNFLKSGNKICEADISYKITKTLNLLIASSSDNSSSSHTPVKETVSFINEHFGEPLTLNILSEKVCLSPFYLSRIFAKEIGMTPYQYLISTRVSAAKFMLKSTSFSIKEIAYRCGFSNTANFCTTFKKWENQTPKTYRNNIL